MSLHLTPNSRRPAVITFTTGLLMLLFAAGYLVIEWPNITRQYYDSLRQDDLHWIGASVEGIESLFSDRGVATFSSGDAVTKKEINSYLDPLFAGNSAFAGIRIFDQNRQGIFERVSNISNPIKAVTWLAYHDSALSWKRNIDHQRIPKFTDNVYQLQELVNEQGEITESLERMVNQQRPDDAVRASIYHLQYDALSQALSLSQLHPLLEDAVASMKVTYNNLELEDQKAFIEAFHSSEDAEEAVSLALEDFRATTEEVIPIPAEAKKNAPVSQTWGGHIWPLVQGRQIYVPLYIPAASASLIEPAGMVEATFYHYPGDILAVFNWRWFLVIIPLIASIILFRISRKLRVIEGE